MQQPSGAAESRVEDFAREDSLAADWATLWQSELAAIAADPETQLVLQSLAGAWLQAAAAFDAAPHRPRADAAPGAAAAAAAAGARDAAAGDLQRLRERVAELERRLADAAVDPGGPSPRR